MSQSNIDYHLYFKKLTNISGKSISSPQMRTKSFTIDVDLLKKTTSTFYLLEIPDAIEVGDIVGIYDSFGTVIFNGVVSFIDDTSIQVGQMNDIFEDSWWYRVSSGGPNPNYERVLRDLIINRFTNNHEDSLLRSMFHDFQFQLISSTAGSFPSQDNQYVMDFSAFLYDVYEKYNIQLLFDIPFAEGNPTISIGKPTYDRLLISDNTAVFRNFKVTTNVYETNKLIVYSADGSTLRGIWYGTTSGITTDSSSLNRLQKINTNIVFSDDSTDTLVASALRNNMYNHEIICEMVYDNELMPIDSLHLGQPVDLYHNDNYYDTLLTGYQITCEENSNIKTITLKFGLVRTTLTGKLYKKYTRRQQYGS